MTDPEPPKPSQQDPLNARTDAIIEQAVFTALQIKLTTPAHPWLLKVGLDPETAPTRLRALAEEAREREGQSRLRGRLAHLPWIDVAGVLPRVRQWQRVTRQQLHAAAPEARRAVGEVRRALRPTAQRLAGTMTMLQGVIPTLQREADVLGSGVDVPAIVAEATTLLAALEQATSERGETADVHTAAAAVARRTTAALRTELRLIRRQWRYARDLSGGRFPELDLGIARADVASRAQRRGGDGA